MIDYNSVLKVSPLPTYLVSMVISVEKTPCTAAAAAIYFCVRLHAFHTRVQKNNLNQNPSNYILQHLLDTCSRDGLRIHLLDRRAYNNSSSGGGWKMSMFRVGVNNNGLSL